MGGPRTSHGRGHALNGKARHATLDEQHAKFPGVSRRVFGKAKNRKEVRLARIGNQVLATGEELDITLTHGAGFTVEP